MAACTPSPSPSCPQGWGEERQTRAVSQRSSRMPDQFQHKRIRSSRSRSCLSSSSSSVPAAATGQRSCSCRRQLALPPPPPPAHKAGVRRGRHEQCPRGVAVCQISFSNRRSCTPSPSCSQAGVRRGFYSSMSYTWTKCILPPSFTFGYP